MPGSQALLNGDPRALARAISIVEEQRPSAVGLLREVFTRTGQATVIGLTGSPGSGKSSLVDRLVERYRADGSKVGVVAVDPSSAFSGGAILGDRVRMQRHARDEGVFIRSMATRGHLGGLSQTTNDAVDLIDAAGFDPVLVETVGVGQDEIEVVRTADVVAVVLVPGMGDDIQAIKAGILEIADLFVINKSDLPGADKLEAELAYMLDLVQGETRQRPAIVRTVAVRGEGLREMCEAVRAFLSSSGRERRTARRRERAAARLRAVLSDRVLRWTIDRTLPGDAWDRVVEEIASRRVDPYTAVDGLIGRLEVR